MTRGCEKEYEGRPPLVTMGLDGDAATASAPAVGEVVEGGGLESSGVAAMVR